METRSAASYLDFKQQIEQSYASEFQAFPSVETGMPGKDDAKAPRASGLGQAVLCISILLLCYFATNLVAIPEIYFGGFQTAKGDLLPTPISSLPLSAKILFYVSLTTLEVFCAVKLVLQDRPLPAGMYIIVPILAILNLLGFLLRNTGPAARALSYVAVLGGTFLTGLSVIYFIESPIPLANYSIDPLLNSLRLQVGLLVLFSGILNLIRTD